LLVGTVVSAAPAMADQATTAPGQQQVAVSAINGKALFASTCGFCHSKGGREAGKGPKLAGSERSDEFIVNRIEHGVQGKMPAFGAAFTDEQVHQILAYIRSLEP